MFNGYLRYLNVIMKIPEDDTPTTFSRLLVLLDFVLFVIGIAGEVASQVPHSQVSQQIT
jgi:hypothetical protein